MIIQEQRLGGWQQQPNAGYVARLKLLYIDDVVRLAGPDQLPVPGRPLTVSAMGLDVATQALVTELVFPPRTCTFSESSSLQGGQVQYALSIQTSIPAPGEALLTWLDQQAERRFLALWVGHNGSYYVAGQPDNGLWLMTGRSLNERDSLSLTIQGLATHPVWYLESYDNPTLFPDVDFDLSFDLSFSA
ncbi:hypothetical protein [Larkinella arboricola]